MRALNTARANGRFESEGWRVRKDGSRFWALAVIDAVRDENGGLVGFAKITRDMSERREAQLALQRAQEQFAQMQKMDALGQLTGGVAHDFNNLLMVVTGQAHIMKKRIEDPRLLRSINIIEQAAKNGARLTRQLLAFARRQKLTPEVLQLSKRVDSFRDLLASSIPGNIVLSVDLPESLWPVEIDPGEFELAVVNLIVNARDAMPNGGAIEVKAENVRLPDAATDRLTGDFVAVTVTDTGEGIPSELLSKIFEPFFTTKEGGKGTGLGLAQVYGFAHQSGGTVTLDSEVGAGTAVTMYLPRSSKVIPGMETGAVHRPPTGGGTILVVEDNPEVGKVSVSLLEDIGYTALLVGNADEALAHLSTRPNIDLVFSDIVMPGEMDGIALAARIGMLYPRIPVVLTSGYSRMADAAQKRFPILRKPYELAELAAAIKAAIANPTPPQLIS
jgi:signal transduction histidine kinase